MIELREFTKLYRHSAALLDVSCRFESTGLSLIVGSNGAGKSTFLRACAGLIQPSRGTIERRGRFAYVGHSAMLYPELSVEENLRFFAGSDVSFSAIDWLELGEIRGKRVKDLSQGQRARVSLARAVSEKPSVLLLDEPCASFDATWKEKFTRALESWLTSTQILMVTHAPSSYARIAARISVFERGRLVTDTNLANQADAERALEAYREALR